jgi:hypothetical protein
MATIKSINKKCNKVISSSRDTIYIRPKKPAESFSKEIYATIGQSGNKSYVFTIDNQKGHYLGYSHKKQEPGYYPKKVAIQKAISWMKKKGVC